MSEDKKEILFPVFLSVEEAHLILRAIYINECTYLGVPFSNKEVSDDDNLRLWFDARYQKIKGKLNAIIPQSDSDVMTKSKLDQMLSRAEKCS